MTSKVLRAPGLSVLASTLMVLALGCSMGAVVTEGPQPSSSAASTVGPSMETPPAGDVMAVSASAPSAGAADAIAKCHVGDMIPISSVTGMGQVASAADLVHYVPLTGREPQLREAGPAWIIQVHADVPQPGSGEIWTDPTCVVTQNDFGYFATGPVRNAATGAVVTPAPPIIHPDRKLPPLAP